MSQTSNQQIISPLILEQIQKAKNTITKINKEQCLQLENLFQAFKTRLITEIDKQQDKTKHPQEDSENQNLQPIILDNKHYVNI